MEQIVIKHIDGTETPFPNRALVAVVTRAEQRVGLMGEDVLSVEISSAENIRFSIGDYIDVFGKTYTLNQLPSTKKNNSHSFVYSLSFESEQYELMDCAWLLPDDTVMDSFTGTLEDFLKILINTNIARSHSNWSLGTYPVQSETKTLTFSDANCLSVLQNLCSEFNVEFEIVRNGAQRILNIETKIGDEFPFPFHYGRTGGLYNIDRKNNNNKNVITRLYAFGSSQNIPSTYRHKRLCLPGKVKNESFIEDADNIAKFGHRENVHNFDDLKPERVGNVTVVSGSVLKFTDSTMFDLNEKKSDGSTKWLIPGTAAKIEFKTGNLAGYSFDVNDYSHATHTFTINSFTDENGAVFPNPSSSAFQFANGDEYIITDIVLPDSYISAAETRLAEKAREYYDEYCKPHVDYSIQVDYMYLRRVLGDNIGNAGTTNIFNAGDQIHVIDDDLGIDEKIRIASYSRDMLNPYSYNLTLSNNVTISNLQRVIGDLTNINRVVQMNNLTDSARAKRNWKTTQEVLDSVFDQEGDYYTEKIKPNSIETQMLAVGARPQQFTIKNGLIEANYGGNPNTVHVNAGVLEHYTVDADGVRTWILSDTDVSGLNPDTTYYIYAQCDKNGNGGQIVFSDVQRNFNPIGSYYYMLCGVLSSVMTGADGTESSNPNASRNVALTYGSTSINGRYINTGRIQSRNGDTFFDLDSGIIGGNIDFQDSVITESIYIKNGKDSQGQTQYCGAISGNEYLPVMWVSENSTTDVNKVAEFANSKCPIKITKNGYGSNIGCLNIIDENATVINGASGMIKMSADSILNENAALAPLTIPDTQSEIIAPTKTEHIKVLSGRTGTYTLYGNEITLVNGSVERIINLVNYVQSGNIKFHIIASDRYSFDSWLYPRLLLEYSNGAAWRQLFLYFGTSAKQTFTKQNSASFTLDKNFTIDSNQYTLKGKLIKIRWRLEFNFGCSNFYSGGDDEAADFMFTNFTEQLTTPVIHWNNHVTANIMAAGGFTSALDSDNYFKLYPWNNTLYMDFKGSVITESYRLNLNSSYVIVTRMFNVVCVNFKIDYGDMSNAALKVRHNPTQAQYVSCDYYGRPFVIDYAGNIVIYSFASGQTSQGSATYIR